MKQQRSPVPGRSGIAGAHSERGWWSLLGTAAAVLAITVVPWGGSAGLRAQGVAGATGAVQGPVGRGQASGGFSHDVHRGVQCTSCHVSGSSHGALKVRTRQDCLGCHHSPARAVGCVTCHGAGTLPGPTRRSVQVRTSVSPGVSSRSLPFSHAFHGKVACGDCHDGGLEHRPVKDCTACHDRHHTPARDCRECHRPDDVKAHPVIDHTGCGGGGCHTDGAVASLSWSRTVCLSCHQNRAQHQVGRDCATCHQVPAPHTNGNGTKEVTP